MKQISLELCVCPKCVLGGAMELLERAEESDVTARMLALFSKAGAEREGGQ